MPLQRSVAFQFIFAVLVGILQKVQGVLATPQVPLLGHHTPFSKSSPVLDEEFSAWIEEKGKGWGMKGVAVAVVRRGDEGGEWITETKGYGVADRWDNAVDQETLFSVGSNSKLFTALSVGMLVENASVPLQWTSKIKDIVPNDIWSLQDKFAEDHANIVDILSHRTGLPRHDLSYSREDTLETTLSKLRFLRPAAEFRELFQYNNLMYMLAAHIVSRIADTKFVDYVNHNIINPLGLSSTTYNVTRAEESGKLADGFIDTGVDSKKGEGRRKVRLRPIPYWNREGGRGAIEGAGGVISNAKDLAIWLKVLLLSGRSPTTGKSVVPAAVVDRVALGVTVAAPAAGNPELSPVVYGMGQDRYTYQGHELIEHNGGTIGHYSIITRVPHDGLGIAVLTNWDGGDLFMEAVKYRLLEKSLALPHVDWDERLHKIDKDRREKSPSLPSENVTATSRGIHELEGVYFNPGYGTLTLCAYPPTSFHIPRPECATQFPDEIRSLLNNSESVLLTAWPKVWSSHIMIRQDVGGNFNALAVYTYPAPFPKDHSDDEDSQPFAVISGGWPSWPAKFTSQMSSTGHRKVAGMEWTGMWNTPTSDGNANISVWFDRIV